jgi:hypothetical protein
MAVKSIQMGQVWRRDEDGQSYLVTRLYTEVFSQYAILRLAGATGPDVPTVKVKVLKEGGLSSLPGYTFTQEGA